MSLKLRAYNVCATQKNIMFKKNKYAEILDYSMEKIILSKAKLFQVIIGIP
jgi:hypothetical protein